MTHSTNRLLLTILGVLAAGCGTTTEGDDDANEAVASSEQKQISLDACVANPTRPVSAFGYFFAAADAYNYAGTGNCSITVVLQRASQPSTGQFDGIAQSDIVPLGESQFRTVQARHGCYAESGYFRSVVKIVKNGNIAWDASPAVWLSSCW